MEPFVQPVFNRVKEQIFNQLGVAEHDLTDLKGFENYVYAKGERVIRITHESHRNVQQLEAELAFLDHLRAGGGCVAAPLRHDDKQWVKTIGEFHVCLFERALGESLRTQTYTAELSHLWGRAIGGFHRLSQSIETGLSRMTWREDENHHFAQRIPQTQQRIQTLGTELMIALDELPDDPVHFGLIHGDAHAGNFLVDDKTLTFFDFDDCIYAWFGYDLATILVGVALHPSLENTQSAREQAVMSFMPHFLAGYGEENDPAALLLPQLPLMMRLREFSLYAVVHSHMDPDNIAESYPRRFMQGRRQRMEQQLPFVDLDFARFSR